MVARVMYPVWVKVQGLKFQLTSRTYEIPKGVAKRDPLEEAIC